MNAAEAILCVQLTEVGSTTKLIGDLIKGRGLVMLSHKGLVSSFGLKHICRELSGL